MSNTEFLHSIDCIKKYGVPRSTIQYMGRKAFKIPENIRDCFSKYYLLSWNSAHLFANLICERPDSGLYIRHQDINYVVVFTKTRDRLQKQTNVWLSFRQAQPEFNIPAYVLIS